MIAVDDSAVTLAAAFSLGLFGSSHCLGNTLRDQFWTVGCPAEKNAFIGEVDRAKLYMCFKKVTLFAPGKLQDGRKFICVRRLHS